jgi:hypothetical protein
MSGSLWGRATLHMAGLPAAGRPVSQNRGVAYQRNPLTAHADAEDLAPDWDLAPTLDLGGKTHLPPPSR